MSAPMDIDVMGALERMVGAAPGMVGEVFGMAQGAAEGSWAGRISSEMAQSLSSLSR